MLIWGGGKPCRWCRNFFVQVQNRVEQRFCNVRCKSAWHNRHTVYTKKNKPVYVYQKVVPVTICKRCKGCGRGFSYKWPDAKAHRDYCKHACKSKKGMQDHRDRQKQKRAEAPA